MTVKRFPATIKDQICLAYFHKNMTVTELAKHFDTSNRTIGRILEERGLATPVPRIKGEAYLVMKLLEEFKIHPGDLRTVLGLPRLNDETVQAYLNDCSKEELAKFFYTSGLVKLAAAANQVQANV